MEKVKNSRTSHRREVLKQIVERYLHKRREESRRENLKDIKVTQELLWRELARRLEGFPRSPFALTPVGRRTIYQVHRNIYATVEIHPLKEAHIRLGGRRRCLMVSAPEL